MNSLVKAQLSLAWVLGSASIAAAPLTDGEMARLESRLPASAGRAVDFEREVKPIFDRSCIRCHGPNKSFSRFRLDSREELAKGGANGAAILPGQSARSPLVFYSARLVEEMEMPPEGKAPELTAEEVGVLRAWIDQGADWPLSTTPGEPRIRFSTTPTLQWVAVDGDERKFREHTGIQPGWSGGLSEVTLEQDLPKGRSVRLDSHFLFNPEDFRVRLEVRQKDFGWIDLGVEQHRDYDDDTGGFFRDLTPSALDLDRDLFVDRGRAWITLGSSLPDRPKFILGYERLHREGLEATLTYGDAGTQDPQVFGTDSRKYYPGYRRVDEEIHRFKLLFEHEIAGVRVQNVLRGEIYGNDITRTDAGYYNLNTGALERQTASDGRLRHFQASDSFRLEKRAKDWLFFSGGYHYSKLEGEFGFNQTTLNPVGGLAPGDRYWFAREITLDQQAHIFNINTQLGPWRGLDFHAGVQNEWLSQTGLGNVNYDEVFIPGAVSPMPAGVDSNLDRASIQEYAGARYTAIPKTVLFAEARLKQESIDQTEQLSGSFHEFLRDTDGSADHREGRMGFTLSPHPRVSLTSHYKIKDRNHAYDHRRDEATPGAKNEGYSGFITSRDVRVDEFETKLSWRPNAWLKATLNYRYATTDHTTETESYIIPAIDLGGGFILPAQVLAPGGAVVAGQTDAHTYGAGASLTPWDRWSFNGFFSATHSATTSGLLGLPAVVAYEGNIFSGHGSFSYHASEKTTWSGGYSHSWADYDQGDAGGGVPVGLVYNWHTAHFGVGRKLRKNMATQLQYRFWAYDESNTGGRNNYTAHGLVGSMTITL